MTAKIAYGTLAVVILVVDGWLASTANNAIGGVFLFLLVGALLMLVGAGAVSILLMTPAERIAEKKAREAAEQPKEWIPIHLWRGFAVTTNAPNVQARCTRCSMSFQVDGIVANAIAKAQNLGNRMIRGGTKMEQLGATFTPGASGRRIAAGNEAQRHDRELGAVRLAAACPSCSSAVHVQLKNPAAR